MSSAPETIKSRSSRLLKRAAWPAGLMMRQAAHVLAAEGALQARAHVARRAAGQNNLGEIVGHQQQGGRAHARIDGGDDRGYGGADAQADDPDTRIAFLLEPAQAGARIEHGLPVGVDGQAEIFAGKLARKADAGRAALVVIGKAELHAGDAAAGQQRAESPPVRTLRVPVGQKHDGAISAARLVDLRARDRVQPHPATRAVEGEHRALAVKAWRRRAGEEGLRIGERAGRGGDELREIIRGARQAQMLETDGGGAGKFGLHAFGRGRLLARLQISLPSEHVEGSHCGWSGPREGAALSLASRALPPGASRAVRQGSLMGSWRR